jgi:hypothetical protein
MKPSLTFTSQMFAAAIDRRKDVTRRVALTGNQNQLDRLASAIEKDLHRADGLMTEELAVWNTFPAPYGPAGTILPMVTSWAVRSIDDVIKPRLMHPVVIAEQGIWFDVGTPKPTWAGKNRPARFLPKSLYHLAPQVEIVSTRAEPLHDITEVDAIREGCSDKQLVDGVEMWTSAQEAYAELWDSINADRHAGTYAWDKNPIVWRIEFKLL